MNKHKTAMDQYGIDAEMLGHLKMAGHIIEPHLDRVIDQFYDGILQDPEKRAFFKSPAIMQHAKDAQRGHWSKLFSGKFSASYFSSTEIVGRTHYRIGLQLDWYFANIAQVGVSIQHIVIDHYIARLGDLPQDEIKAIFSATSMALMFDAELSVTAFSAAQNEDFERKINERHAAEAEAEVRAREKLTQKALELERSNTELEKFAYVAAHDLRSPLRGIRDLATWILEDTDTHFSQESQESMDLLMARVGRLNDLLNDLLAYSRAGREGIELETINIEAVVADVSGMINARAQHTVSYDGVGGDVTTHALPLRQILLNLIGNAIKHNDRDHSTIMVRACTSDGWLHVSVVDDGPGIAEKYQERIFEMFQTLRSRDEVEGSGMGLAIVRKMAEHFGGSVEVLSDPEAARGTTFNFKLPLG